MAHITKVTPILVYDDIAAAHDFLVRAFAFESGGVQRDGSGTPVHAEVNAGGTAVWLHRVTREHRLRAPTSDGDTTGGLFVHVDDVDEHYERARANGAHIEAAPVDQPYGQREYAARDPEGHRWWFGAPIP
jgi:uncharacterized glyoxalase superfamily protein PhnB